MCETGSGGSPAAAAMPEGRETAGEVLIRAEVKQCASFTVTLVIVR